MLSTKVIHAWPRDSTSCKCPDKFPRKIPFLNFVLKVPGVPENPFFHPSAEDSSELKLSVALSASLGSIMFLYYLLKMPRFM